jgi:hypothetical protein
MVHTLVVMDFLYGHEIEGGIFGAYNLDLFARLF